MAYIDAYFERIRECEGWHAACEIMMDEGAMSREQTLHVSRCLAFGGPPAVGIMRDT